MDSLNVLIVEDEAIVALEIKSYLESIGCNVIDVCSNANCALEVLKNKSVNLVMMDIYLQDRVDGIEATKQIKKLYPNIQIIFLTANNDNYNLHQATKLEPLSYLAKPFNRQELLAAIEIAKIKIKKDAITNSSYIKLDNEFSYDINSKLLYYLKTLVHLTDKESQLLSLMIKNKNSLISNYTIENELWPSSSANPNTIRTLVSRLRKKLKNRFIQNISARGYMFVF